MVLIIPCVAQEFLIVLSGSISSIDQEGWTCRDGSLAERQTEKRVMVSGVVGAASSVTSIQVANLLRLFKIPQVEESIFLFTLHSTLLDFFLFHKPRVIKQTTVRVFLTDNSQWPFSNLGNGWARWFVWMEVHISYLWRVKLWRKGKKNILTWESSIIYTSQAYEELERLLGERGICQAVSEKLPKDSGVAGVKVYDDIVEKLLQKRRAKGTYNVNRDYIVDTLC